MTAQGRGGGNAEGRSDPQGKEREWRGGGKPGGRGYCKGVGEWGAREGIWAVRGVGMVRGCWSWMLIARMYSCGTVVLGSASEKRREKREEG